MKTSPASKYVRLGGPIALVVFVTAGIGVSLAYQTVVSTVLTVVGAIAGVLGLFKQRDWPTVTRTGVTCVIVVDVLLLAAILARPAIDYANSHRTIDVTAQTQLTNGVNQIPGLGPATLTVTVPEHRDHLVLVVDAADSEPSLGICAPYTALDLRTTTPGVRPPSSTVAPGAEASLIIGKATSITLEVHVQNTHGDRNCGVNLSVARAELRS